MYWYYYYLRVHSFVGYSPLTFQDSSTRALQLSIRKDALGGVEKSYSDVRTDAQLNLKMFYAQRNMYLTGFTLFLAM